MIENNNHHESNTPVRVLQFTTKLSHGGVQTFLMSYADHMDHSKVIFDYVVQTDEPGAFDEKVKSSGSKIFCVTSMTESSFRYMKDVYSLLKEHPEYQIVHAHLNYRNILPLIAARRAGVKYCLSHSHSDYAAENINKKIMRGLFKCFLPVFATDYMACSKKAGEWLYGKKRVDRGKVKLIHNAVDPSIYRYSDAVRKRIRDKYSLGDKTVLVHVGTFGEAKNHQFLLAFFSEYVKSHPQDVLILCGDGELRPKIESTIKQNHLEKNVLMLGMVNNVNEFYNAADVMLLPSLYEGLPLSTIEAQASGCPCVVSSAVPEEAVFNDNVKILSSWDVAEWQCEVEKLVGCRANCDETETRVRSAGFDISVEAKKLENLYLKEAGREYI